MTKISIDGEALQVSREVAIDWIARLIIGPLEIMEAAHWGLTFSVPGRAIGYFLRLLQKGISQLRGALLTLDDDFLVQTINEVLPYLTEFNNAAQAIRTWQKGNVPKRLIATHNKAIRQGGPATPPWSQEAEFARQMHRLSVAFSNYLAALLHLIPAFQRMLPIETSPVLSEQLERSLKKIPDLQNILVLGYAEAVRKKATTIV